MVEAGRIKMMETATTKASAGGILREIDLNKALAGNGICYLLTVNCDSMVDAGIHSGDRIIVDRELNPLDGNIVIAAIDDNLLIRRLQLANGKMQLMPAAPLAPILFEYYNPELIWGVVTYVIQRVK
jgi:DNA polymerase V